MHLIGKRLDVSLKFWQKNQRLRPYLYDLEEFVENRETSVKAESSQTSGCGIESQDSISDDEAELGRETLTSNTTPVKRGSFLIKQESQESSTVEMDTAGEVVVGLGALGEEPMFSFEDLDEDFILGGGAEICCEKA